MLDQCSVNSHASVLKVVHESLEYIYVKNSPVNLNEFRTEFLPKLKFMITDTPNGFGAMPVEQLDPEKGSPMVILRKMDRFLAELPTDVDLIQYQELLNVHATMHPGFFAEILDSDLDQQKKIFLFSSLPLPSPHFHHGYPRSSESDTHTDVGLLLHCLVVGNEPLARVLLERGMTPKCEHGKYPVIQYSSLFASIELFEHFLDLTNNEICPCQEKSIAHWVLSGMALPNLYDPRSFLPLEFQSNPSTPHTRSSEVVRHDPSSLTYQVYRAEYNENVPAIPLGPPESGIIDLWQLDVLSLKSLLPGEFEPIQGIKFAPVTYLRGWPNPTPAVPNVTFQNIPFASFSHAMEAFKAPGFGPPQSHPPAGFGPPQSHPPVDSKSDPVTDPPGPLDQVDSKPAPSDLVDPPEADSKSDPPGPLDQVLPRIKQSIPKKNVPQDGDQGNIFGAGTTAITGGTEDFIQIQRDSFAASGGSSTFAFGATTPALPSGFSFGGPDKVTHSSTGFSFGSGGGSAFGSSFGLAPPQGRESDEPAVHTPALGFGNASHQDAPKQRSKTLPFSSASTLGHGCSNRRAFLKLLFERNCIPRDHETLSSLLIYAYETRSDTVMAHS